MLFLTFEIIWQHSTFPCWLLFAIKGTYTNCLTCFKALFMCKISKHILIMYFSSYIWIMSSLYPILNSLLIFFMKSMTLNVWTINKCTPLICQSIKRFVGKFSVISKTVNSCTPLICQSIKRCVGKFSVIGKIIYDFFGEQYISG